MSRWLEQPASCDGPRVITRAVVGLALAALGGGACSDAVTLEIASDRPVPTAIDALCVGIADTDARGGHFGAPYRLEGDLASLPQTLRVEAGSADEAWAWVRGDRGGVPVARAAKKVDFGDDVTLTLDRCERGPGGAPSIIGDPVGPAGAKLAASQGQGGTVVVAIGATANLIDAKGGSLVADDAGQVVGVVLDVIAADLDRDCDDDLVLVVQGAPPRLWRRDGRLFSEIGPLGALAAAAVDAADVDRDGDLDLVVGGGGTLALYLNDGAGGFTEGNTQLSSGGRAMDVRAIAFGDLDGDGNTDLVVGQRAQPLVAWLGDPDGTGTFRAADAVVPPVPLDVASLTLVDADGDFDPDLAVALTSGPLRLYIDRDGRLEDQTFVRLPQPTPFALAIAFGGWDEGCEPDAILARDGASAFLSGTPTGELSADVDAPPATDAIYADIDDDGDLDAILATAEGVIWLAR
ncbi:MAG: FG-GAP repeat domain-containing protein [Kofleriaceae bacterium]